MESRRDNGRIIMSISDHDFVLSLYKSVLHRNPTQVEIDHWLNFIKTAPDPGPIIDAFLASDEYLGSLRADLESHGSRSRALRLRFKKQPWENTGGFAGIAYGKIKEQFTPQGSAGLPPEVDVIVPTCNASSRIQAIHRAYVSFGINPLYIVDSKSSDGTLEHLQANNCRCFSANSDMPYVESLLFDLVPYFGSEWVLRFDDDELPTEETLRWIQNELGNSKDMLIGFPRKYVLYKDGNYYRCEPSDKSWDNDTQFRLFRPAHVVPLSDIHTPGVFHDKASIAPVEVGFLHLDWLARSPTLRARKLHRYDSFLPGCYETFRSRYLPEEYVEGFYATEEIQSAVIIQACDAIRGVMRSS